MVPRMPQIIDINLYTMYFYLFANPDWKFCVLFNKMAELF